MAKRTTISLDDADERVIASVSEPNSVERAALVELVEALGLPIPDNASEAALIRALLQVGARAVHERALDRGYAKLAELWDEVHDAAETRERRRRYADRVDHAMP